MTYTETVILIMVNLLILEALKAVFLPRKREKQIDSDIWDLKSDVNKLKDKFKYPMIYLKNDEGFTGLISSILRENSIKDYNKIDDNFVNISNLLGSFAEKLGYEFKETPKKLDWVKISKTKKRK